MANPYEISRADQVQDVRPWGTRTAEKLSEPVNLLLVVGILLSILVTAPITLIVILPVLIIVLVASRSVASLLPIRYPPGAEDPTTKKPGNGIWFLGNMVYEKKSEDRLPTESAFDAFKETWFSDDDLRKHLLILGSTGSGKSELLKGIFFCALCWGSGFFVADGKADNKLPLDNYNMARFFGRDDDLLTLNFLLAGKSPAQVRNSRRRRTNKTNPFSTGDADTIIQMGANLLPKVDGDAKNWQEKALNCWRGLVPALCWLRDNEAMEISATTFVEYLSLAKIEELYIKGYTMAQENNGVWLEEFTGIKSYLEVGVPGFKVDRVLRKYGAAPGRPGLGGKPEPSDQDSGVYDQHGYRATQLNPALGLLGKTYGHIFQDKYSEIDMVDVTMNNRILVMLIPSLEKSAQEAESLGKLTVACLRVMMGRSLGAEIEGTRQDLLEAKATEAPYPYVVALDELGYYFADGIAVMFAQARSLGFCMIAAAQDIEKLTEGTRSAEAGAMLANQVCKVFMRIDDANKTNEMIQKYLGKVNAALKQTYEFNGEMGFKRVPEVRVEEIPVATLTNLAKLKAGRAILNTMGKTFKVASFYVGDFLSKYPSQTFHVNRFLQIRGLSQKEVCEIYGDGTVISMPIDVANDAMVRGAEAMDILVGAKPMPDLRKIAYDAHYSEKYDRAIEMLNAVAKAAQSLPDNVVGARRAIALYMAAKSALLAMKGEATNVVGSAAQTEVLPERQDEEFVTPADAMNRAGAGESILTGSSSGIDGQTSDVHDDDPFAFLNEAKPLHRKPVTDVFPGDVISKAPVTDKVLKDVIELMGSADLRETPPPTVVAEANANNVKETIVHTPQPLPLVMQKGISEMVLDGFMVDLTGETKTPSEAPKTADSTQWIGQALGASALAAKASGGTVMGFTPEARAGFENLERALGSENPGQAAAAIEQLVSSQTTPPPLTDVAGFDDIEAFLQSADEERT